MLLFSFVGLLLFRFDAAKLLELLFQLPPRKPRKDELIASGYPWLLPSTSQPAKAEHVSTKPHRLGMSCVSNPRPDACCHLRRRAAVMMQIP